MNIYDISEKSGYSIATVSRVINGKRNVSQKAIDKIMSVVEELSYVPNAYARGLGSGSLQTIGLLCVDVADIHLAGMVSILEREFRKNGYHSLLGCTGLGEDGKRKAIQIMLSQKVDAIILIGSHFILSNNDYILAAAEKVPIIILNGQVQGDNIYCITVDDYGIIFSVMDQFLEQGHKRFLYVYDLETPSGVQKRQGYRDALIRQGIPKEDRLELHIPNRMDSAQLAISKLLEVQKSPLTAILAAEDLLAIAALKALKNANIPIPEAAQVVGYNNSIISQCSIPDLTSIDNKMEALCMVAASTLFGIFQKKRFPRQTVISASIENRQSTKEIFHD